MFANLDIDFFFFRNHQILLGIQKKNQNMDKSENKQT